MGESIEVMQSKCNVFNQQNPVGSPVTVVLDFGQKRETRVKYAAGVLSGHTPVVWLEGISGCYVLDRVMGGKK